MRPILACCLFLLLTACGGSGPGTIAANACATEVSQRLAGKTFDFDKEKLVTSAEAEAGTEDIWHLSVPIVFDRGLSTEFTQNLKCKTRVVDGKASVLSLEFIWAIKDLKLDGSAGS